MDVSLGVEVGNRQRNIMADANLSAVQKCLTGLQELCQTSVHEFHEENGKQSIWVSDHSKILNDIGMPKLSNDITLLFKLLCNVWSPRDLKHEEIVVDDFSSTEKAMPVSNIDSTIGT